MAKAEKPKKPRGQYEEKLIVKGSFSDLMKAAAKDAQKKSAKKKE